MWFWSGRPWSPAGTPAAEWPTWWRRAPTRPCTSRKAPTLVSVLPDATGHFDRFGGKFVPEALFAALLQLEREFVAAIAAPAFNSELAGLVARHTRRPSPLHQARRLSRVAGGPGGGGGRPTV